ncbi:M23 family metallopeptidase [Carboxylicivirga sp. N1Y90]|uniref:M23 family metallopeptidase n=1 Tax=Carboxylicivirga fragile TaxID=3417571 RepID=UPI003D34E2F9|nr:M23 family metallopeptidase [Marinilabiliaceae bacterium N1Y90]
MRYTLLFVLMIGLNFMFVLGQNHSSVDFVKPMKIKPVVSGSFGELRSNHFHSGIDLTTNGKTGYRIYASDKGSVSRIKVSAGGYGKALYIDHPSGHTTVYAHLERYSNRIDSIVTARQYKQKSFEIELFFKADELPVERGEVVAYSGNSGSSGGPHLHYEIRNKANQKPLEPMAFRDDIEDDVKPQIQGLKLYPISEGASIMGANKSKYVPVVHYDGVFHPKGQKVFKANGEIGIGVQVLDYLSDSWRKCGVTSIELFANDTLVYHSYIDAFSFAETRYLNAHIDYDEKRRTGKVIQRSYVLPNNRLSIYKKKNTYSVKVNEGEQKLMKYVIKDFSGNTSIMTFTLQGEAAKTYKSDYTAEVKRLQYAKSYTMDTLGLKLEISAKTFYEDIDLLVHRDDSIKETLSPVYTIGDEHIPLHKFMKIGIAVPDSLLDRKDKLLLLGYTGSGKTYSRGGSFDNGYVRMSTRNFGRLSLGIDTIAPKIKMRKPPAAYNYASRQSIEVTISDNLSGIAKYECFIDGKWVLFEYDAKRSRLIGQFKQMPQILKGEHSLLVYVRDNKNNVSELEIDFRR